jgi:hypothetical protein
VGDAPQLRRDTRYLDWRNLLPAVPPRMHKDSTLIRPSVPSVQNPTTPQPHNPHPFLVHYSLSRRHSTLRNLNYWQKQTNFVALSPRANYADCATATCRRNLVPTFVRCRVVSAADPLRSLNSIFYTGAATFLSSSSSFILTRAVWTPFQTHCYSKHLVAPGIEPVTFGLAATSSDH